MNLRRDMQLEKRGRKRNNEADSQEKDQRS